MSRRVLLIVSSDRRRGAQLQARAVTGELQAVGVDATLVALEPGPAGAPGLDVEVLGPRWWQPSAMRRLRTLARTHDLVVAFGSTTLPASATALAGVRTPFVYRSIGDPAAWVRGPWHRRRTGLLMRRAAAVFALWPGAAESINTLYRVPSERITCLPNARSPHDFHPAAPEAQLAARRLLGVPERGPVVAWLGSIAPEKRLDLAVDAIGRLDGVHLLVAGGSRREAGDSVAEGRADHITFTGVVDDTTTVYAAADVVLSTSATEGMPGVVIEAALSGVPVVATAVGAVPWLYQLGVAGSIVPADAGAGAVADAVHRTLQTASSTDRSIAPDLLAACTWPAVTPRWIAAIERVLDV